MGNYIGMLLDERLSIGNVIIRVILNVDTHELIDKLRMANFGLTILDAEGGLGKVKVVFSIVKRKHVKDFVGILNQFSPNSFYTIEEIRSVNQGVFRTNSRKQFLNMSFGAKKHK